MNKTIPQLPTLPDASVIASLKIAVDNGFKTFGVTLEQLKPIFEAEIIDSITADRPILITPFLGGINFTFSPNADVSFNSFKITSLADGTGANHAVNLGPLTTGLALKSNLGHTHLAADVTDFQSAVSLNADVAANTAARHTHANKALLDTYTQTEANLADAVSKKHTQNTDTKLAEGTGNEVSAASIVSHIASTANPHSTTLEQARTANSLLSGDFSIISGGNFDTQNIGDTLNIGGVKAGTLNLAPNTTVINIGTGTNTKVFNLGNQSTGLDTFNFYGALNQQNVTNLAVSDKLVTYNVGGAAASGGMSGFEIEENAVITAYFKTTSGRDGWLLKAPANNFDTSFLFAPTANNDVSFPDKSGTVAFLDDITTLTLSAIGSSPNTNGATITGLVLNLEPANASFGGVVTTANQTFAGTKTTTIWEASTQFNIAGNFFGTQDATNLRIGNGSGAGGTNNTFIGINAGNGNVNGNDNIALGTGAYSSGNFYQTFSVGRNANPTANNQAVIGSENTPLNDFFFGEGVTLIGTGTPDPLTFNATGGKGADMAGGSFTIAGGKGTGTGAGGDLNLAVSLPGIAGSTLNALTNALTILGTNGKVGIGNSSPTARLTIDAQSFPINVFDTGATLSLRSTSPAAVDAGSQIHFVAKNTSGDSTVATIAGRKDNVTNDFSGYLQFSTQTAGGDIVERMRITATGKVGIGTGTTTPFSILNAVTASGASGLQVIQLGASDFVNTFTTSLSYATTYGFVGYPSTSATGGLLIVGTGTGAGTIPIVDVQAYHQATGGINQTIRLRTFKSNGSGGSANLTGIDNMFDIINGVETVPKFRMFANGCSGFGIATPTGTFQVAQVTAGTGTGATTGTTTFTGTNTKFTNTFKVGDTITVSGETVRTIATITSDTVLDVTVAFSNTASALTYTLVGGTRFHVSGNGNTGIGTTAPTGALHIKAGTAAASSCAIKLTSGVAVQTTKELGAVNYDGTNIYLSDATLNYTILKAVTGSATLNFSSISAGTSEILTIAVTGAALNDEVLLGIPNGSASTNLMFHAWVSATDVVSVMATNNNTVTAIDPASGTFKVSVIKR